MPMWLSWPVRHPWWTVVAVLVACAAAALFVLRLRPDASLEGLFPRDSASGTAVVRVLNDFAVAEELLVLVSVPEDVGSTSAATPASSDPSTPLLAYADRLERAVRADPQLGAMAAGVVYKADPQTQQFFEQVVVPAGFHYLDDAAFAAARRRLTPEAMREQMRLNEAAVSVPGPAAGALNKLLLNDPLRLHEFLLERFRDARALAPGGNAGPFDRGGGAFLSPDSRSLLVRIPGKRPPSDLDFTKAFTAGVERVANEVNTDRLDLRFGGSYAIAAASEKAIRTDAVSSTTTSFIYLGVLFFLAYRSPLKLFTLAFVPVLAGVLLGFGAYAGWSSSITPMTAVLGAMLAEMGINYTVHYLSLYDSLRGAGRSPAEAAAGCNHELAMPTLAAWCTSIVGFVAVGLSSLRVLRDFAILGTLTLLGAVAMTLTLLPAILVLVDRRNRKAAGAATAAATPLTRLRFAFTPALRLLARHGGATALVFGVASAVAMVIVALPGDRLPLETDLTVMHPKPNAALDTQAEIARRFGASPESWIVFLQAKTPAHLLRLAHDVDRRLAGDAARTNGVAGSFGLATLLPDPRVASQRPAATDAEADRIVADFRAAVADSPFDAAAYEAYARFLRELLTRRNVPAVNDLLQYPSLASLVLPRSAVDGHVPSNGASAQTAITLVSLDRGLEERQTRAHTIDAIRSALSDLPGATLTGMTVVSQDAEAVVHRDLPLMLGVGSLAVAAYLLVHFRSVRDTVLIVIPTVFSVLVLMAAMRLGLKLNMVNLVAAPLLIGINIDYGICLVSLARAARERGATAEELIGEIGTSCHAVLVCALTTVMGFGSLVFMAIPAVRSLGVAVSLGVLSSLAATVLFLAPLLIRQSRRPSLRQPTASADYPPPHGATTIDPPAPA
jgi:predicted RND superfamily exporter protein